MLRDTLKRTVDILAALFVLVVCAPIWMALAVLVRLKLGKPVLFRQSRPGLHEKEFEMVKFRTMTDQRDANGELLDDAARMTRFGSFLRSSSLDELPEFWNVLKGEMSLVGPRPLLTEYLPRYNPRQRLRHQVRPGVTGWAQVNGRNAVDWDERLEMDAWYVENYDFWLDLKIIFLTVNKVVKRDGISAPGHVTKEKFMGTCSAPEHCD